MSWQRVRGHGQIIDGFNNVMRRGRLAHAYLFAGPSGVGKHLFARELAKAFLCEGRDPQNLEACDQCASCKLFDAGTHPDFFAVCRPEESLELPIDSIRDLCQKLSIKPARGKTKVAVVDDADDLNDAAANCFLKTLEEPPPGSLLILIVTSPERQPTTIVSRCQVVRFRSLEPALVEELLRANGTEDPATVSRLVRLSGGSIELAQALADPALWNFRSQLLDRLARPSVEGVQLAREWMQFLEEAGKDAGAQRRRASLVIRLLVDFFSDALRVKVGGQPKNADPEDLGLLQQLCKRVDAEALTAILERCLQADYHVDRRAQLVLTIEALVDALAQMLAGRLASSIP